MASRSPGRPRTVDEDRGRTLVRMAGADRLERLTDLVLVLLAARRPLTLEEIAHEVPGYPEGHGARRQAFERDKHLLREEHIPVRTEAIEGPEQFGYRIDPAQFYLPDLELDPDEQGALNLAVAGVHLGEPSGRDALAKIGAWGSTPRVPLAWIEPHRALAPLFDAVNRRAEASFLHRGATRRVAPAGLWFRRGRWYLVGWDRDRQAVRTFRVDRLGEAVEIGPAGSGVFPEGIDAAHAVPGAPWRTGDGEEEQVRIWVDPVEAARVIEELGSHTLRERHRDGSIEVEIPVTNVEALRTWALGLLDHAVVTGPEAVRRVMIEWLVATEAVADLPPPARVPPPPPEGQGPPPSPEPADPSEGGTGAAPVRGAAQRLRRLFAIMGWLARQGEVPLAEVAERFSIAEDELVGELELAACCGIPPYTPDVLMEIVVTGSTVRAFLPEELARPRRLSVGEAFSLITAARTLLAVPGSDPDGVLGRAVGKLEDAVGARRAVEVDLEEPPRLPAVRAAIAEGSALEIRYHSGSRDETTTRVVDPVRVASIDGRWYLDAFCHRAGGPRLFRVDRIRSLRTVPSRRRATDDPGAPGSVGPANIAFVPGPEAEEVVIRIDDAAAWVLDDLPAASSTPTSDGGHVVRLLVGGRAWLQRLLLQLGPHGRVLGPDHLATVGAEGARRVRQRYETVGTHRTPTGNGRH